MTFIKMFIHCGNARKTKVSIRAFKDFLAQDGLFMRAVVSKLTNLPYPWMVLSPVSSSLLGLLLAVASHRFVVECL